jgi:hypothetical protein
MSSVIRAILLRLARQRWFRPVWSARIGEEWIRNAARVWNVDAAQVRELWEAMRAEFPDADPGDATPYEVGLRYSDPKDFHVIAAGLAAKARRRPGEAEPRAPATWVMTWNLKDFNRPELRRLGMDAFNPDRVLAGWYLEDPAIVQSALRDTPADVAAIGRPGEPLAVTLGRERLYRLRALAAERPGSGGS